MNAICLDQLLHFAVLWKQRHRRNNSVCKNSFKVFTQCKAGPLNFCSRFLVALLRLLYKFLNSGFHGAQHQGGSSQSHHFKCAYCLVQLLACDAQLTGIQRCQIRASGCFRFSDETFECLR